MVDAKKSAITFIAGAALAVLAAVASPQGSAALAATSEVKAVVNGTAITSGDVAKRVAFLRLQRAKGDAKTAEEELVNELLKRQEIARVRMSVSTQDVDASFERFAAGNKLSVAQMSQILERAGVGVQHFKNFIAVQMSWPRVVNARFGKANGKTLAERMQENGGKKPVTTEYFLKQVIFVVPEKRRNAILGKRKAEAEASRAKFPGCDQAKAATTKVARSNRTFRTTSSPGILDLNATSLSPFHLAQLVTTM